MIGKVCRIEERGTGELKDCRIEERGDGKLKDCSDSNTLDARRGRRILA